MYKKLLAMTAISVMATAVMAQKAHITGIEIRVLTSEKEKEEHTLELKDFAIYSVGTSISNKANIAAVQNLTISGPFFIPFCPIPILYNGAVSMYI